jgi:hypothetical protein
MTNFKRLRFFSACLIGLFLAGLAAQEVAAKARITPQKRVYRRKIKDVDQFKKTFTVISPKFTGLSAAARQKADKLLDYERVFEINLVAEINQTSWLEELSYEVNYNKYGILAITLTISGSGAYPDSSSKIFVVNLATGNQVKAPDVFQAAKLPELLKAVRNVEQAELKKHIKSLGEELPQEQYDAGLVEGKRVQLSDLDHFRLNDKGVTFVYDYGFPHAIEALQPDGLFFLSWAKLRPYIKREGLLGRFIR